MLENFSQEGLKAIMASQEIARQEAADLIQPRHLLLGILKDPSARASKVLREKIGSLDSLLSKLEVFEPQNRRAPLEIPYSEEVQRIFESAEDASRFWGHEKVESDHLLLSCLHYGPPETNTLFTEAGVKLEYLQWNCLRARYISKNSDIRTASLDRFGKDLTAACEAGELPEVLPREALLERLIQYLGMYKKHRLLLVGEHGVGKSSMIQGLNQYILESRIFRHLAHRRIVTLHIDKLLSENASDDELYSVIQNIFGELRQAGDIILVVENIHQLLLANKKEMEFVITQPLLTLLETPDIYCIATTTPYHYREMLFDSPVRRLFQKMDVAPPSAAFCESVLKHWQHNLEAHHALDIQPDAIKESVRRAGHIKDLSLPESALTLLDLSCARKIWQRSRLIQESKQNQLKLSQLVEERAEMAATLADNPEQRDAFAKIRNAILATEIKLQKQSHAIKHKSQSLMAEDILQNLAPPRRLMPIYKAENPFALARVSQNTQRILDIGCGDGGNARILNSKGHHVEGITYQEAEAQLAKAHCQRVWVCDLEQPLPAALKGPFDLLFCSHILEHLVEPQATLKRLLTLLKPGGEVIVALPNLFFYRHRWELLRGRFNYTETGTFDKTHLRWFSFESGKALLESCGLTLIEATAEVKLPLGRVTQSWPKQIKTPLEKKLAQQAPGFFGFQLLYHCKLDRIPTS